MSSLVVRRCLQRSSLVEQLAENWQLDHDEAMFASDVEELCRECIDLCDLCERSWRSLVDGLFNGKVENTEVTGRGFKTAVEKAGQVLHRVNSWLIKAEKKGFQVEGSERFKQGLYTIESLGERIDRKWPFFNSETIEQAREEYRRGEYHTIEELLGAMEGNSSEAHQ